MIQPSLSYRVYFTPLIDADANEYADEIEVTDRILLTGVGSIRQSIDSSDYDIGLFTFSDLELKGYNYNGYFNEIDSRSVFYDTRDRCKVRVVFFKTFIDRVSDQITDTTEEEVVTFRGIINEEATRLDFQDDTIRFKVLSRDSVFRTTKIPAGIINDDTLISDVIYLILNQTRITSLLTLSALNINPDLDIEVDDGSWFDNKSIKEALDKLLFASNSVLIIDDAGVIYVKSRDIDPEDEVLFLYGQYDEQKRENIVSISDFNTGRQRTFTQVQVNDFTATNEIYSDIFGLRKKSYTLEFITDNAKEEEIAERLVDEFKSPKSELKVTVPTDQLDGVHLLQTVSVNYPYRVKPIDGKFLPVFGVTEFGDVDAPFPLQFGSSKIDYRTAFKIIEIEHQPENFLTTLKLRQVGISLDDGFFNVPTSNKFGFGVFGSALFGDGDPADAWNPSVFGGGRFGLTRFE